nr:MAG TPA: hypothetical protein [Caudoviricetes sp.]
MKKFEQLKINYEVRLALRELGADGECIANKVRLKRCKAYIEETRHYYVLISYNTMVAFIDKRTGICYDVLRLVHNYSITSSRHIAKFCKVYCTVNTLTYRFVRSAHD